MSNWVKTCARLGIPVEVLLDDVASMRVNEGAAVAPFNHCVVLIIPSRIEHCQHLIRVVLQTDILCRVKVPAAIETVCVAVVGDCVVADHALLLRMHD